MFTVRLEKPLPPTSPWGNAFKIPDSADSHQAPTACRLWTRPGEEFHQLDAVPVLRELQGCARGCPVKGNPRGVRTVTVISPGNCGEEGSGQGGWQPGAMNPGKAVEG